MSSFETRSEPPIVSDGGLSRTPGPIEDPYRALDDLMVVVEALCPVWPRRPLFSDMPMMRL